MTIESLYTPPEDKFASCSGRHSNHWFTRYGCPGERIDRCARCGVERAAVLKWQRDRAKRRRAKKRKKAEAQSS